MTRPHRILIKAQDFHHIMEKGKGNWSHTMTMFEIWYVMIRFTLGDLRRLDTIFLRLILDMRRILWWAMIFMLLLLIFCEALFWQIRVFTLAWHGWHDGKERKDILLCMAAQTTYYGVAGSFSTFILQNKLFGWGDGCTFTNWYHFRLFDFILNPASDTLTMYISDSLRTICFWYFSTFYYLRISWYILLINLSTCIPLPHTLNPLFLPSVVPCLVLSTTCYSSLGEERKEIVLENRDSTRCCVV